MSTEWTKEMVDELIELHSQKVPYKKIGKKLGVTKNAVSSKVRKLGLSISGNQGCTTERRMDLEHRTKNNNFTFSANAVSQERTDPIPPDNGYDDNAPKPLMIGVLQLTDRTCKYPYGDPKRDPANFGFCGLRKDLEDPYCAYHKKKIRPVIQARPKDKGSTSRPRKRFGRE